MKPRRKKARLAPGPEPTGRLHKVNEALCANNTIDYTLTLQAAFSAAIRASGIEIIDLDSIVVDGKFHSFYIKGDGSKRYGWAKLQPDGTGYYGDHRQPGASHTWRAGDTGPVDPAARAEALEQVRRAERAVEAASERARAHDDAAWHAAKPAIRHPYLTAKGVQSHGLRVADGVAGGVLLVPRHDMRGVLRAVQYIQWIPFARQGAKRFTKGARVAGTCLLLGKFDGTQRIGFAEGYATAASVFEHEQLPVVVAFDCNNMIKVACQFGEAYPLAPQTIFADNDKHTPSNPGLRAAREIQRAMAARIELPPDGANDWNDYWNEVCPK